MRQGPDSGIFRHDAFVSGEASFGNNFAKGYTQGDGLLAGVAPAVQGELGRADAGEITLLVVAGIGGGTGGGLACAAIENLRQAHPDANIVVAAVLSDVRHDSVPVRPYNETLALRVLQNNADLVILLDNAALHDAVSAQGSVPPGFSKHNEFAGRLLSLLTSPTRMARGRRPDMLEFIRALTPKRTLRFAGVAVEGWPTPPTSDVVANLQRQRHRVSGYQSSEGHCLSPVFIVPKRKNLRPSQLRSNRNLGVGAWFPPAPAVYETLASDPSVLMVESHTGLRRRLERIGSSFDAMFSRRAFVHWYTSEGMSESQLGAARSELGSIISAYGQVS